MTRGHARSRGNGKWQLEVDIGKKVGGKGRNKKYRTVTAKSEKEAQAKLAVFVNEVKQGGYFEPEDIGFVDFVHNRWMPDYASRQLADTTLEGYVFCLNNRILPAFQHFKLKEISQRHIIDFINNLSEDGMRLDGNEGKLSSSQIRFHYRVLKNIIEYAIKIRFLKDDPFEGVDKPPEEYKEIEPYSLEETAKLFDALEKEKQDNLHWYIAIRLAVLKGMRRSELFGLDLEKHIDIPNNVIRVRQALTYTKERGYSVYTIKKGSRRAKRRDISLAKSMVQPLEKMTLIRKKEKMAFGKNELWERGDHLLLLSQPNGKPFNPDSMRGWWERFIKRHKLRYINIHALRHTMVNLLIELDTPLAAISKRAGHSGIGITSDTYGHRIESVDEMATNKLDEALSAVERFAD